MKESVRFVARQVVWDLSQGLLARPGAITVGYGVLAVTLVLAERRFPQLTTLASKSALILHEDVAASQLILATIAGSMMTTISIVFAVLVMALSLASIQFSPRVILGFMSSRPTQNTLGIFVGTFVYSLLVLRTVENEPEYFVPALSVSVAMALAVVALASLVYFIHHIGHAMHANHIVDRIASQTLLVVEEEFPERVDAADPHHEDDPLPPIPEDALDIEAPRSGYVQLIDRVRLTRLARQHSMTIYQHNGIGEFVIEGNPLLAVHPARAATPAIQRECARCFDLGEVRTLQQDVHFGMRQIVDMGLKAISPAVNDPSTAVTCIDHLGRILCRLARRRILPLEMRDPATGALLMVRRAVTFRASLDLAFNQLRQYGANDMAVCLRILRALTEIVRATEHAPYQERVLHHAALVEGSLGPSFAPADREEFHRRLSALRSQAGTPAADLSGDRFSA